MRDMEFHLKGLTLQMTMASLIIALDCGIKSLDHVTQRNEISILSSVITTDLENLPEAIAVLDPKRDDCNYPYDELCGCGIDLN
jgi:single-stranded-DNA-specific exonuclease